MCVLNAYLLLRSIDYTKWKKKIPSLLKAHFLVCMNDQVQQEKKKKKYNCLYIIETYSYIFFHYIKQILNY